jgi:hypothetical protein
MNPPVGSTASKPYPLELGSECTVAGSRYDYHPLTPYIQRDHRVELCPFDFSLTDRQTRYLRFPCSLDPLVRTSLALPTVYSLLERLHQISSELVYTQG